MKLSECLQTLVLKKVIGDINIEITGIEINSQQIKEGNLFIALRGHNVDGHQFISQAMQNGATAILAEEPFDDHDKVVSIIVPDTRKAMAVVANEYYHNPTQELNVIGVTGTNGKTTTTHMIETILQDSDKRTGLMGTMQIKIGGEEFATQNTTPNALELQRNFRKMRDADCKYAVIEVSSHALHMGRTWGSTFKTAVFTNLTQDHLDYHQSMENYRAAKGLLFSQLPFYSYAVLNTDDSASHYFREITSAQVITYGINNKADVWAKNLRITAKGTQFTLHTFKGTMDLCVAFIGTFNIYNALAAVTVALLENISLEQIKNSLEAMPGVRGRFESVNEGQPFTVIVDYAHTPDSLENVLLTIQEFCKGRLICVVGCGGDRDRTKRPIMAQIATKYSDTVFLTSDNPRSEDPNEILMEMVEGIKNVSSKYNCIVDRKEAIKAAIEEAQEHDVVVIAGKGHETYQEINGKRYSFDDREIAKDFIQRMDGDTNATNM